MSPYCSAEVDLDRNKEFVNKLLALYGTNGKWVAKLGKFNDECMCFFMSYNFNPSKPKQSKAMLAAEASSQTVEWQFFAIASQRMIRVCHLRRSTLL